VASSKPLLALAVSSEELFANGSAKARINVFLISSRLPQALNVRLSVDRGKLEPERLVIPSDSDDAEAFLSSTQPGQVKISAITANPESDWQGEREKSVYFAPSITKLDFILPDKIRQVDSAELVVYLANEQNVPTADGQRAPSRFCASLWRWRN
jgi:hypothetical protein